MIVIFSGAGLSAESGIGTFRSGTDALWDNYKIEDVCDIRTFHRNYELVLDFYDKRISELKGKEPNAAHLIIKELQDKYPGKVINLTTNVDLLLEKAGLNNVHHLHGRLDEVIYDWNFKMKKGTKSSPLNSSLLDLKDKNVKPNVVFFNECCSYDSEGPVPLYQSTINILGSLTEKDTLIVIGASMEVVPIQFYDWDRKCLSIFINPDNNLCIDMQEYFDYCIPKIASLGLKDVLECINQREGSKNDSSCN